MLTNKECRNAQPSIKPLRMSDTAGRYLLIQPNGSKWWRLDYRLNGKRNTLSLGTFPNIGLKDARAKRDAAKKPVEAGIDPSADKKSQKLTNQVASENTFYISGGAVA